MWCWVVRRGCGLGGLVRVGSEGEAVGEDEGVVELDSLDAEFVEEVEVFGRDGEFA